MNIHRLNHAPLNVAWMSRVGEPISCSVKSEAPEQGGTGSNTPSVGLITFSINGTEYQAKSEMAWGEWCDSEYNTDGYYVDYLGFGGAPSIYVVSDEYITDGSGSAWSPVAVFKQDKDLDMDYALSEEPTNKIIAGYDYRLFSPNNAE